MNVEKSFYMTAAKSIHEEVFRVAHHFNSLDISFNEIFAAIMVLYENKNDDNVKESLSSFFLMTKLMFPDEVERIKSLIESQATNAYMAYQDAVKRKTEIAEFRARRYEQIAYQQHKAGNLIKHELTKLFDDFLIKQTTKDHNEYFEDLLVKKYGNDFRIYRGWFSANKRFEKPLNVAKIRKELMLMDFRDIYIHFSNVISDSIIKRYPQLNVTSATYDLDPYNYYHNN